MNEPPLVALALIGVSLASCKNAQPQRASEVGSASRAVAAAGGASGPHAPPGSGAGPLPFASCAGIGPAACDVPPAPLTQLCSQSACIIQRAPDNLLEGMNVDCDRPRLSDPVEASFVSRSAAPAGAGVTQIAMVELVAGPESRVAFDASYLVAELGTGWCLVDVVLGWNQRHGYVDSDFSTRWEPGANGPRLHLRAHRVMHEPLDREADEGTSDVSYEHCDRYVYELSSGRFVRVSSETREGACEGQ